MELIGKTNIDFIGQRKISFIVSGLISLVGLVAVVQIGLGTANLGIDFSGGTQVQLKFDKPLPIDRARAALAKHDLKDAGLQEVKEGNKLLIKVGKTMVGGGKAAEKIEQAFHAEVADNPFTVESSTEIGPSIGDKLRKDTLVAVVLSMLGIIAYIAWRFDFKFGIAATAATLHDVLAIFAVFMVLGKEVDLLLITAALTVAGYSLTDTVVVFDRIRENMHKNQKEPLATIFNRSINEVLSRTVVTSLTVLLASLSLALFGGEVIHNFALALVIGVVVGTYSSIFVASPIAVVWENRAARKAA